MQRYKKIAAILLLSIFSMFLLHQILPHAHHDHEDAKHLSTSEHSHIDDHHHHHNEYANLGFDLLGLLFGNHPHDFHVDNIVFSQSIVKKQSTVKIAALAASNQLGIISNRDQDLEGQVFWQDPPDPTKTYCLSSGSRRGPPSLG